MKMLMVTVVFGLVLAAAAGETVSRSDAVVVEMRVTRRGFDPRVVVKRGQAVVLKIIATGRDHGIVIPGLGVPSTRLPKGGEVEVRFTADRPGSYRFKCSVLCGWRHTLGWVSGVIVVK